MRRTPLLFRPTSSAIDATRFTSTSPHAFSKPAARSSRPSASTFSPSHTPQRPPPSLSSRPSPLKPSSNPSLNNAATSNPNTLRSDPAANGAIEGGGGAGGGASKVETPAEKVARLRAARAAARSQVQIGTWDRIVVTGRVWSDRLHRFTAVGLIGLTVLAGLVTTYSVASIITYNRKKRNAFYADQIRTQQELVLAAIEAEKAGLPMTEEQQLMLNREKARFQAEEERKARPGWVGRVMAPVVGRLGGGVGEREREGDGEKLMGGGAEGVIQATEEKIEAFTEGIEKKRGAMVEAIRHTEKEVESGLQETVRGNLGGGGKQAETAVLEGFEQARSETESSTGAGGGSLDQRAEKMAEAGRKKVEGWGSWFGR